MKQTGTFRRYRWTLTPNGDDARAILDSIPEHGEVLVEIRTARSIRQLRLFWSLMTLLAENVEWLASKDDAADQIKIDVGEVDWFVHHASGVKFGKPRSIAVESMLQDRFNRFMDRILFVIERDYAPGCSEDFKREMHARVDGPSALAQSKAA
jgi:hypothetical protein